MNTPEKEYLKEYLTVKELCTVMGISEKTFYINRMAEKLPGYKIEKSITYRKKDIEKLRI